MEVKFSAHFWVRKTGSAHFFWAFEKFEPVLETGSDDFAQKKWVFARFLPTFEKPANPCAATVSGVFAHFPTFFFN